MSANEPQPDGEPGRAGILDILTGRIGKLTALIGALAGLVAAWQTLVGPIIGGEDTQVPPPKLCVEIDAQEFPAAVKYSDWETTPIRVKGRNNCDKPIGVYATFVRRQTSEPRCLVDDAIELSRRHRRDLIPPREEIDARPSDPIPIAKPFEQLW